jgi:hypothetical protein
MPRCGLGGSGVMVASLPPSATVRIARAAPPRAALTAAATPWRPVIARTCSVLLTPISPIPADANDLRDAVGIVCVSLVDLKRQRGLCMTRVDADDRQLPCPQLVEQPGRELAGFQTDPRRLGRMLRKHGMNAFRGRAALASPNHGPGVVDNAHRGLLERDVQSDILLVRLHGLSSGS